MRENEYYTERAVDWVRRALGEAVLTDGRERAMRFLEEAVETAQACGLTDRDAEAIVGRVFSREKGEPAQEIAGAYFTLLVLARQRRVDVDWELLKELRRVDTPAMIARIREKHAGKVAEGTSGVPASGGVHGAREAERMGYDCQKGSALCTFSDCRCPPAKMTSAPCSNCDGPAYCEANDLCAFRPR